MFNDPTFPGYHILYPLDWVATILSLLGSIVMGYISFRVPPPLTTSVKFIRAIAIVDFLYSLANVISAFETKATAHMCYIEAIFRHSFFITSVFFACCVAIVSYKSFLPECNFNQKLFFQRAVIFGPLVNIFLNISLPIIFPQYLQNGDNGSMNCSLVPNPARSADEKFVVVMLCRGCPIMLGLIIIFKGYYNTIRELQNLPEGILIEMDYNIYKLLWYPTVLLVVFTPSVIDQLVAFYNPGRPIWLTMLRVGITHSLGFYNCIMYVMMRKLYNTPDKYLERNSIDSKSSRSSSFSVTEELLIAGARL